MATQTLVGTVTPLYFGDLTADPSSIPAFTVQTETFTITGLNTQWCVSVNAPNLEAGVVLLDASISAANTLKLTFHNVTGAAINPASQVFKVVAH